MDQQVSTDVKLEFTGTGSEYFRIWIVNILLSIVTLGIYSAWAKVRTNKYFYSCTRFDGSSFEYHGNAMSILKGRLVVVATVILFNVVAQFNPLAAFGLLGAFMLVMPWLAWRSLQFKLYNTSYRGVRFGFDGSAGAAYWNFLVFPVLSMFTLFLLYPKVHQSLKRFQHTQSRYGTRHFGFSATAGEFYMPYLAMFGFMVVFLIIISIASVGLIAGMSATGDGGQPPVWTAFISVALFYVGMFIAGPIFYTMLQNLIWNKTTLGEHQFKSQMKWNSVLWIMFSNLVLTALTLGLFIPFAKVRMMKYRLESTSVAVAGSLDEFVADTSAGVSALGEGAADILDFDLSM